MIVEQDPETGRFVSGNIGGPGRPRGSRNKLGEAFIADLYADWLKAGPEAIKAARAHNPAAYLRVVASILPKQLEIKDGTFDGLTDEQLASLIVAARDALGICNEDRSGAIETAH